MAAGYFSGGTTTYSYDHVDQGGATAAATADHHINHLHTLYLMNPAAATTYVGFPMDQATTSPANMQALGLLQAASDHDVNSAGFLLNSNLLLRQLQYNLMWRNNNNVVTISEPAFAEQSTTAADDQQISGNHHDHDQLHLIMSPTNTGQNLPSATTACTNSVAVGIGSLIGTNNDQQQQLAGTLSLSLSSSAPDHLQRLAASNVLQLLPVINVSADDQAGDQDDQMKITRRPMKWDHSGNILQMGYYPCNKYVKAAQQLLDEVVNVRNIMTGKKAADTAYNKGGSSKLKRELSSTSSISGHDQAVGNTGGGGGGDNLQDLGTCGKKLQGDQLMSVAEKQELQVKKTKLVTMLDEVEQRYRQYHLEMQLVVSSFEAAAGVGAANTYTALALHTISKQFRCLRDAISAQVRSTSLSLGEDHHNASAEHGSSRHLRYVDQNQLRQQQQQRALQQLGMIQQNINAWRPQRGLPERAVSVLRAWLFEHFLHPYPKDADKRLLAKQTGLTRSQVSNWFINARVRLWKPMVEEMYTEELKQQHEHNNELLILNNNNSDDHQLDVQIKDKNTTTTATTTTATSNQYPSLKTNDQSTNSSTKSSATTTTTTTTPSADDHDQIISTPPVTTHAQQITKIKKTTTKLIRQLDQKKDSCTPMNSNNDQNMMKKTNTMEAAAAAAVIPTSSASGDPDDQNIVPTGFNMINAASSSDINDPVPIAHLQLDHMAFLNHINSDSKKMIFRNMNGSHRDSMMITTMSSSSTNIDHNQEASHHDQLINSNQDAHARNIKEYAMNINDDQYHSSYRSSDVTTYAFTTASGIDNNIGGGFGAYHQLLANNINATSCRHNTSRSDYA